jgi:hypothetical protein
MLVVRHASRMLNEKKEVPMVMLPEYKVPVRYTSYTALTMHHTP